MELGRCWVPAVVLCCGSLAAEESPGAGPSEVTAAPSLQRDYSFGYWKNGMRRHEGDPSADILSIETGYYGLELDMKNLDKVRFGRLTDELDYAQALDTGGSRMDSLTEGQLEIQLEQEGKVYRAVTCGAGVATGFRRLSDTRLWESARYVQNFELQKLKFVGLTGEPLVVDGRLSLVGWPESFSLTAELSPGILYKTGPEVGVRGAGYCVVETPKVLGHEPGMEHPVFTLETWIKVPAEYINGNRGWILCKGPHEAADGNFGLMIGRGQVSAAMNIGGKGAQSRVFVHSSHQAIDPDRWHHLAMSYDGKTTRLWVDGRANGSAELGKPRVPGAGKLVLGQRGDGHGGMRPVVVDQVRIWNRVLDQKELVQHTRDPGKINNRNGLTYENNFDTEVPAPRPEWTDASIGIRVKAGGDDWHAVKKVAGKWGVEDRHKVTLSCPVDGAADTGAAITVAMKDNPSPPVAYDPEFQCHVAKFNRPKRSWRGGYREIREYDEIDIVVNSEKGRAVPFLLEMIEPASITGLCPILVEPDGTPTGIPVQLSKNWHYSKMGSYLRAFMRLPAGVGKTHYKLRIPYGFYGKLPSASHSQLSLVGYGGNGRWDQLAIGCWGETYCMDMDMSCVDVAVTDVRMLMARSGTEGRMWSWTDAGWGGDWLGLNDAKGQKHYFNGLRTAYLSHGPCLTSVKYDGYYGANREIDLAAEVNTLRTDDYARTFTTLEYRFDQPVSADGWLFKMGRTSSYVTPKIAYGNKAGLIEEREVPNGLKMGDRFGEDVSLEGEGPWWVSFPGAYSEMEKLKDWGTGYRAMVIRSYKAVVGGKEITQPVIGFEAFRGTSDGRSNLDFQLKAPVGVTSFQPGDSVVLDVEWITLPRVADDYYGPNEAFRKHLAQQPSSWVSTHREAAGNDLQLTVAGGRVIRNYPIVIACEKPEVSVDVVGGVGYVPIRFEGLKQPKGYSLHEIVGDKEVKLDQSAHGNDFWQVDPDPATGTYAWTFNLPLDGKASSRWVLRAGPQAH